MNQELEEFMSFYEPLFYEAGVDMASLLCCVLACWCRFIAANATTAVGLSPALLIMSLAALQPLLRWPLHSPCRC